MRRGSLICDLCRGFSRCAWSMVNGMDVQTALVFVMELMPPLPAASSHLLRTAGPAICSPTVLLRIEFTASTCLHAMSELLPHFSTLTPASRSGISLLHLSEGHPWRALPVILALRSPDFPHAQAFALCPRSFGLLNAVILTTFAAQVNNNSCKYMIKDV